MKWFNGVILFIFVLASCAPSDRSIQTAIVRTQVALPTTTVTVTLPPVTPSSTSQPNPTATSTITLTPTLLPAEITDAQGISMHLVPAGEFTMGFSADEANGFCQTILDHIPWYGPPCRKENYLREEPVHKEFLNNFFMDVYEVSNQEYKKCVTGRVCVEPSSKSTSRYSNYYDNESFSNYPVLNITWDMAKTYCEWRGARLPTEAEWEKAARGIDGRSHPWVDSNSAYKLYDPNFYVNKANLRLDFGFVDPVTVPIDSNAEGQSPFGLYNMAGNVAEWVADWYGETYYKISPYENPPGPAFGEYKVIRGGSVNTYEIRTTARDYGRLSEYDRAMGIRCARDATP